MFQLNSQAPDRNNPGLDLGHTKFDEATMRVFSANAEGTVGFYKLPATADGAADELGANKAYLDISGMNVRQGSPIKIVTANDMSGVEDISIDEHSTTIQDNAVVYDIYGRRVTHMVPGNIYIVDGKKIVYRQ